MANGLGGQPLIAKPDDGAIVREFFEVVLDTIPAEPRGLFEFLDFRAGQLGYFLQKK
ncbi:MAG: hypothetical protein GWN87_13925 [Desulfuromonadales bacterium]|nr:hypothetical protein [Desulfuromonadales bacterium]NIS41445.1 hypothetical protein [Desulfuromonadales bacterium]